MSVQPKHKWLPREYNERCIHDICETCGMHYLDLNRGPGLGQRSNWQRYWVTDEGRVMREAPAKCLGQTRK